MGGIFIETTKPLSVGTKLKVQFCLPGMEKPVIADGIVVHKLHVGRGEEPSMGGMGIKFSELEENSKLLLEEYIQSSGAPGSSTKKKTTKKKTTTTKKATTKKKATKKKAAAKKKVTKKK